MSDNTETSGKKKGLLGKIIYLGSHDFYDYGLIFVVIFLMLFGLIMVYSTTAYSDTTTYGDAFYSLKKQGFFAAVAMVLMLIISKLDYHLILKLSPALYVLAFVLCVYVHFAGTVSNGSSRWLSIAGVSVQPSELAKPALIMVMTLYLTLFYDINSRGLGQEFMYAFKGGLFTFVMALPVLLENLSTGLIILLIGYFMCYLCTKVKGVFWVILAGLILLIYVGWTSGFLAEHMKDYQVKRITAWLDPENSTEDSAYQILQGLYAIGSGGLFGKGLGSSIQKLGYLPEAQNDMIFTIICEELGICGAALVIILYIALIFRLMYIANNAPDMAGSLLASGIMIHISIQVLFNILVVTNLFPNTGITLPFISYGGSALVVLICEMGLALSVSNQIKVKADGKHKA